MTITTAAAILRLIRAVECGASGEWAVGETSFMIPGKSGLWNCVLAKGLKPYYFVSRCLPTRIGNYQMASKIIYDMMHIDRISSQ
jgi:hypothetical protein